MHDLLQTARAALTDLWRTKENISLGDIRPARLPYMLAYALELVLFAARGHFAPIRTDVSVIPGVMLVYAAHGLASLAVMLLWSERFKHLIRISLPITVLGFVPYMLLPEGGLRLACAVVGYIGLGGAVTAARCGYAFALNNAERLVGMVLMTLGVAAVKFCDTRGVSQTAGTAAVFLLLAAMCVCLALFKEDALEVKKESTPADARGLYWALAYFIVYFVIDGYHWSMLDYDNPAYALACLGMVLVAALLFISVAVLRRNIWHAWNLFFLVTVLAAGFALFAPRLGTDRPHYFFGGLSTLGWPLAIYMLACAQRRFASYRLLKKCTVIFVLVSPVANFSDDLIERYAPALLPTAAFIVILLLVLALLMLSPYSYRHLFSAPWIRELHLPDMGRAAAEIPPASAGTDGPPPTPKTLPQDRFAAFGLTPRQREVAYLLLSAKTRRQIAGELGVSESTVKTHVSELYKKLGINSRVELFRLFGPDQ